MAQSKLEQILEAICRSTITEKVSTKHNLARNDYHIYKATVSSFVEFRSEIIRYVRHHLSQVGADESPISDDKAYEIAIPFLEDKFGDIESTHYNATLGVQGGMIAILDAVADGLRREDEERYIESVFQAYEGDPRQIVQIMQEYISQVKTFLPPGEEAPSAEVLAKNWRVVLREYSRQIDRLTAAFRRSGE